MIRLEDNALTTLERLSTMMGVSPDDPALADRLTMLINQASAQVEALLGRKLRMMRYTVHIPAMGRQRLMLPEYPIVRVYSVSQGGVDIDPALYDYSMTGEAGILYKDDGWTYEGYPYGLANDLIAPKRNITVQYTAGYRLPKDATPRRPATLPADLEGLVWEMVQAAYGKLTSGGNAGLKSFGISDIRWDWLTDIPSAWTEIINVYKRIPL